MKKSEIYNPELASLRWRNDITIMQTCHIMQKYERDLRIMRKNRKRSYWENVFYTASEWCLTPLITYIYNEFCKVSSIIKKLAEEFYMVSSITKKTIYSY